MSHTAVDYPVGAQGSASRPRRSLRIGAKTLGATLGVWISLYPFVDLTLRPRHSLLSASGIGSATPSTSLLLAYLAIVLIGIVPPVAGALSFGVDFRRAKLLALAILPICVTIPLSLLSATDLGCLQYMLGIDFILGCTLLLVAVNVDADVVIRSFFAALALALGVALAAAMIDHDFVWGRLWGRTAPNYWGGLGLVAIIATIAMRGWVLRTAVIAVSLLVIYSSQSRGEMISLIAAMGLAGILFARHRMAQRWTWIWFAVALGVLAAVTFGSSFIVNDLFRLSDQLRGLNSGFTGRVDGWREAQALFSSHPWLGVGYQQSSRYMTPNIGVHNGYLATLADVGVIGFMALMLFTLGGLCRSIARAWNAPTGANVATASFLFAVALVAFVEPVGLHLGDTGAMVAIFLTAWAWRAPIPANDPTLARR